MLKWYTFSLAKPYGLANHKVRNFQIYKILYDFANKKVQNFQIYKISYGIV